MKKPIKTSMNRRPNNGTPKHFKKNDFHVFQTIVFCDPYRALCPSARQRATNDDMVRKNDGFKNKKPLYVLKFVYTF